MAIEWPSPRPVVTVHDASTGQTLTREANDDDLATLDALGWKPADEPTPEEETPTE